MSERACFECGMHFAMPGKGICEECFEGMCDWCDGELFPGRTMCWDEDEKRGVCTKCAPKAKSGGHVSGCDSFFNGGQKCFKCNRSTQWHCRNCWEQSFGDDAVICISCCKGHKKVVVQTLKRSRDDIEEDYAPVPIKEEN